METQEHEQTYARGTNELGIQICWHDSLDTVPEGPTLVMGNEFLDALSVYRFEYTARGWREILVDIDDTPEEPQWFKFITSERATVPAIALEQHCGRQQIKANIGDCIETCPAGNIIIGDVAERISKNGGAAIFIDYGGEGAPNDSLQAIKNHRHVHALSEPGECDLTAHVDFAALKSSAAVNDKIKVFDLVTQSYFLQGCGIVPRMEGVLKLMKSEDERKNMLETFGRVVDINKMGGHFKVLGFAHTSVGVPIGFLEPVKKEENKIAFSVKTGQKIVNEKKWNNWKEKREKCRKKSNL
eukprot:UN29085